MAKDLVIKSSKNGLTLIFNELLSFEQCLKVLEEKLTETAGFFGEMSIVLSIEGKSFDDEQIKKIIDIIDKTTSLNILMIKDNSIINESLFEKELIKYRDNIANSAGEFLHRDVLEGEDLNFKDSVVIVGSVLAGAEIHTNGSIVVLGTLEGKAYAGELGNESAFIYASNFITDTAMIADFAYRKPKIVEKKKLFSKSLEVKQVSKMIFIEENKIVEKVLVDSE